MNQTKYKIMLSNPTYFSLLNDMDEFNFRKPGKSLNKNKFYSAVIRGYYKLFVDCQNVIKQVLKTSIKKDGIKALSNLSHEINQAILIHKNSDKSSCLHPHEIYIQITKENENLFNQIERNSLCNISMSEFLRNLFNEYISSPKYLRERCLFSDNFYQINKAIQTYSTIVLITNNNNKIEFVPTDIKINNVQTHNYIVGYILAKNNIVPTSIKLSKINKIIETNEDFPLSFEDLKRIDELTMNGPELIGIELKEIKVKFDKQGIRNLERIYYGRPLYLSCENEENTYIFYCDENRMYDYLKQFGNHAKIIYPESLKQKLINFYKRALNE